MSSEIHLFFAGILPTKAELQRAMQELGFPFTIKAARGSLERQSGYMPMRLDRQDTGVEFDLERGRATIEELLPDDVDPAFDRAAALRWGGDPTEAAAGLCAAAALAGLTGGVIFDDARGVLCNADDAVAAGHRELEALRPMELPHEHRANNASIKQMLKPILDQRRDLAFIGGRLMIVPVRHLVRGAWFYGYGKNEFRMNRFILPLYLSAGPGAIGYGKEYFPRRGRRWAVDAPGTKSMICDYVLGDILPWCGNIATLGDYWTAIENAPTRHERGYIETLALSGELALVGEALRFLQKEEYAQDFVATKRFLLDEPYENVLARFHAVETATARTLKLGRHWHPSRFPGEFPEADRAAVAEPRIMMPSYLPVTR
jgi:hypothetical protein